MRGLGRGVTNALNMWWVINDKGGAKGIPDIVSAVMNGNQEGSDNTNDFLKMIL